jgi:outer membrane murein-binding lipoprotein Lpp
MRHTKTSLNILTAFAVFAGTSLVAGCGSDEKVTKTTTTEQSTTTAAPIMAPATSTTTTTTTSQSQH